MGILPQPTPQYHSSPPQAAPTCSSRASLPMSGTLRSSPASWPTSLVRTKLSCRAEGGGGYGGGAGCCLMAMAHGLGNKECEHGKLPKGSDWHRWGHSRDASAAGCREEPWLQRRHQ